MHVSCSRAIGLSQRRSQAMRYTAAVAGNRPPVLYFTLVEWRASRVAPLLRPPPTGPGKDAPLSRRSLSLRPFTPWERDERAALVIDPDAQSEASYQSVEADPDWYKTNIPCQVGCPAHTDVSTYIGLISQGRFDEAYLLNRDANVVPGVLGRTCARPCQPVCRRNKIDGEPVAICWLKRAAHDHREYRHHDGVADALEDRPRGQEAADIAPFDLTVGESPPNCSQDDDNRGRREPSPPMNPPRDRHP